MYSVFGYKKIVSKKDSKVYYELHVVSEDRFVTGNRCDNFFVAEDRIQNVDKLDVGVDVDVFFSRFSRQDRISVEQVVVK
jgi:hypothetical protein